MGRGCALTGATRRCIAAWPWLGIGRVCVCVGGRWAAVEKGKAYDVPVWAGRLQVAGLGVELLLHHPLPCTRAKQVYGMDIVHACKW